MKMKVRDVSTSFDMTKLACAMLPIARVAPYQNNCADARTLLLSKLGRSTNKFSMHKRSADSQGFTLIELMVVILVIAILMGFSGNALNPRKIVFFQGVLVKDTSPRAAASIPMANFGIRGEALSTLPIRLRHK